MTILQAMQSATLRLSLETPESYFGNQDVTALEMCNLANEVLADILAYRDWQALQKVGKIVADGGQTEFPRPADYDRMMTNADMQDARMWAWGYGHVPDLNTFMLLKRQGVIPNPGVWIMYGDQFHFTPAPMGESEFAYISKNAVRDMDLLETKAEFTKDNDEFLLPMRLVTLGLIWKWREAKKMDWTGDREAYDKAMSQYGTKDAGSNIMRSGVRIFNNHMWNRGGMFR